jgi:phosphate transport system substrate-binding protein
MIRRFLAAALLLSLAVGGEARAGAIKIGGSGAGLGLLRMLGDEFSKRQPEDTVDVVPSLGSTGGISAVNSGDIDLGISGRELNDKERKLAVKQRAVADTPFVFATSLHTPPDMTLAEIQRVYRGETASWSDGSPIRLILRPKSDATSLLMAQLIAGMGDALEAARAKKEIPVAATDQDNMEIASRMPGALATMTLTQLRTEPNKLQVITLNGISPVSSNAANPNYPLRYRIYLILPQTPSPATVRFLAFIESDAAAAIIRSSGGFAVPSNEAIR